MLPNIFNQGLTVFIKSLELPERLSSHVIKGPFGLMYKTVNNVISLFFTESRRLVSVLYAFR